MASFVRPAFGRPSPEFVAQFAVLVVALALPMILGFDANYDQHNYHVLSGVRVLHGQWFEPLDLSLAALLNPVINAPYAVLVTHLPARLVSLILALAAATVVVPLRSIGELLLPGDARLVQWQRAFALLIGLSGPMYLSELGTSFADALLLPVSTWALFLALKSIQRASVIPAIAAGTLIGAATGLKQTFAPFALALLVMVAFLGRRQRRFTRIASQATASLVGFAMTGGAWAWMMWHRFRNPIFPSFNSRFRSEYAPPIDWWDSRFSQRSPAKLVMLPFRLVVGSAGVAEAPVRDARWALAIVGVLGIGLLVLIRRRNVTPVSFGAIDLRIASSLTIFVVVGYICWAWQFGIARYGLPVDILSGLPLLLVIHVLVEHRKHLQRWIPLLLIVVIASSRPMKWGTVDFSSSPYRQPGPLRSIPASSFVVLGIEEPSAYLAFDAPREMTLVRKGFLFERGSLRMNELESSARAAAEASSLWLLGTESDGEWLRVIGLKETASECQTVSTSTLKTVRLCPWR